MKKLHALAFYALITPAIALGSASALASHHSSENPDLGEQDMDKHADKNSEHHRGTKKSKYNAVDTTGTMDQDDPKPGDHSGMKKEDDMKSSSGMSSDK